MLKRNRLWLTALALGWVFDLLFWAQNEPGISFFLYVILVLASGYFVLRADDIRPARPTLIVIAISVLLAFFSFLRSEPLTVFLAIAGALFTLMLTTVSYQGGRWYLYGLGDYFLRFFHLVGSAIAAPIAHWSDTRQAEQQPEPAGDEEAPQPRKPSQFWPVVRGLLVAVPVVAFFAALLSSADLVFAERLKQLTDLFQLEKLPEYIFRGIYISMLAYLLVGVFVHAARNSRDEKLLGVEKPLIQPFFGFTEAAIVLGAVALLFGAFVLIQFQYFFGGPANIRAEGYTFSEYARRGFGELVTVAFFSLLLLLGLGTTVKRERETHYHIFSGLSIFIVALVGIMLVSAFQRLVMYEMAYGFTRLRAYTHVFMIWLGLLLIVTAALDLLRRWRSFALASVAASLGFALSLMLMNVDGFIVHQNIQRYLQEGDLDVGYLASLSTDATPVLASYYQDKKLSSRDADAVGAVLACIQYHTRNHEDEEVSWQSFHLGRQQSLAILNELDLDGYTISADREIQVETPRGKVYDCYSYVYD